ncbi:trimethylamine methyltransferase family protein [Bacteroidota bacterium]
MGIRPVTHFLDDNLIEKIISEARDLLCKLGITLHNRELLEVLSGYGAAVDREKRHVLFTNDIIDRALGSAPSSFRLFDVLGNETHDFSGSNSHFTPGSAAINILDNRTNEIRKPDTSDYINYSKLMSGLEHIASTSTAFIPADVTEKISDSYRLYLSLLYCEKPVVTGAFTIGGFEVMKDLLLAVRGTKEALKAEPLAIFSCCPTSPLKFSDVTSQNVMDCARFGIPVEFVSMPLSGFMAPVTLVGSLIQHTAETISGIVISQLTTPGTPMLYGGSPAIFDMRYETTPMGAIETMMIDCAFNEIGKFLNIPTQAYIALSDAKSLDAQAGLESSMGATLAVLSGINNISGPGMLDFENCQSLQKLVLDNEICGMTLRMARGIEPKEDFPSIPLFQELLKEKHLLISKHTRKHIREEHHVSGRVINRANLSRWREEGSLSLAERANLELERLLNAYQPSRLSEEVKKELTLRMENEARLHGMDSLP